MLTYAIKITRFSFVFLGIILLLAGSPVMAHPQSPPTVEPLTGAAAPAAAAVSINLCAKLSEAFMPDGAVVLFWGYVVQPTDTSGSPIPCNESAVRGQLPGPVLRVNQGDEVTITLHNQLPVATSIIFPGQNASWLPTASGDQTGVFTAEAAANGGTATYTFTAAEPGTYLYESGTTDQPQVSMGLYGALIVDPATPGQAYSDASTAYDVEQVLVLSEIDPALNADVSANPTTFTYDLLNYHPTYWLLNGRAYGPGNANPDVLDPDTPGSRQPYSSAINLNLGSGQSRLLVRYLNAGGTHHTMSLLGNYQRIIAKDADALDVGVSTTQQYDAVAETIPSGQTTDAIITFTAAGSYALFNRQLHITNGDATSSLHFAPGGGMMTFTTVTGLAQPAGQGAPGATEPGPGNEIVTVEPAPAPTMHLGGLIQERSGFANFNHFATVTIHDAGHNPVAGATVSGSWDGVLFGNGSGGNGANPTCTTNDSGQCTVQRNAAQSLTFTVNNVTHASLTYQSPHDGPTDVTQ